VKLGPERIAQLAYDAGFRGRDLAVAVAVAMAESGGDTRIPGDTGIQDRTWSPSVGLWQIRSLHADRGTGRMRDELANVRPAVNARHARAIWRERGGSFAAWSAYTNGSYRQYLDVARRAARSVRDGDGIGVVGPVGPAGAVVPAGSGRSGRVVLDVRELARLEALLATSRDRVDHALRITQQVVGGLSALRAGRPDPATARLVLALVDQLAGPAGLPLAARHLDWEERLVARTRTLAESAAGDDGRVSRADTLAFLGTLGRRIELPEAAVLEALVAGGLRLRRDRPHQTVLVGEVVGPAVPVRPALPAPRAMGPLPLAGLSRFGNGRLPASRLDGIGHRERLAAPAARHFRRMAAAARAAGVPLPVIRGYRSYPEQAALQARADGAPVAAPGTSPHGWGFSADLDVSAARTLHWLQANAARYGFFADLPADPATGPTAPPDGDRPAPQGAPAGPAEDRRDIQSCSQPHRCSPGTYTLVMPPLRVDVGRTCQRSKTLPMTKRLAASRSVALWVIRRFAAGIAPCDGRQATARQYGGNWLRPDRIRFGTGRPAGKLMVRVSHRPLWKIW